MARRRWVYVEGRGLVEVPADYRPRPRAFNIIGDCLSRPIRSMADGKMYDSKSTYYASLKERGCEIVGNEKRWATEQTRPEIPDAEGDLRKTASELGISL